MEDHRAHDNEYAMETRRVLSLTDKQLLAILSQRAGDNNALQRLAALIRVFEHAATCRPDHAPGLLAAAALTRLYGSGIIQPGHEKNPFAEVASSVAGCFGLVASMPATRQASKAPPPHDYAVPSKAKPVQVRQVAEIVPPKELAGVHEQVVSAVVNRVPIRTKRVSKSGLARAAILRYNGEFRLKDIVAVCPGIHYSDAGNAMHQLRKQLEKCGPGAYKVIRPSI